MLKKDAYFAKEQKNMLQHWWLLIQYVQFESNVVVALGRVGKKYIVQFLPNTNGYK